MEGQFSNLPDTNVSLVLPKLSFYLPRETLRLLPFVDTVFPCGVDEISKYFTQHTQHARHSFPRYSNTSASHFSRWTGWRNERIVRIEKG